METISEPTIKKARKEHRCAWCNSKIEVGEKYSDSISKYDGEIYHWRECDRCKELVYEMMHSETDYSDDSMYNAESFEMFMEDKCNGVEEKQ